MIFDNHMQDRYCRFSCNPQTGEYERHWIQYADGTFEPVRRVGSLKKKYEAERTNFNWWAVKKPAAWRPWHEGHTFSWNHDLGEESKPEEWGNKSKHEQAAGNSAYFIEFNTDNSGRIESRTENIDGRREIWEFQYDDEGRLTSVIGDTGWCEDFEYDDIGRRKTDCAVGREPFVRRYEYTDDNRLLRVDQTRYEHDALGFRSGKTAINDTTRYQYDADYRLLGALLPDKREISFEHDENGQRSRKNVNGRMIEAYEWLDFIRLSRFHDGNREYVFNYKTNERLPRSVKIGKEQFSLGYDQVGSLKAVVSPNGDVVKAIQYGPFGNILWDSNPGLRMPIGYAGGLYDPDTGFIRFGWRDYDPDTGRWTAQDPLGAAGGDKDWYGYCLDDPVNMFDPLGLYADFDSENNDPQSAAETQNDNQAAENHGGSDVGHDLGGNNTHNSTQDKPSHVHAREMEAKVAARDKAEQEAKEKSSYENAREMEAKANRKGALAPADEKADETLGNPTGVEETMGNPGNPKHGAMGVEEKAPSQRASQSEKDKGGLVSEKTKENQKEKQQANSHSGTRGLGIGLSGSVPGFGLGVDISVHEDDAGNRVVGLDTSYGTDTNLGINVEGSYQKTDAKSVDQLTGTSIETNGSVNLGQAGMGVGQIKGNGYTGKQASLSYGLNLPKPGNINIKRTYTRTWNVPKPQREYAPDLW